MCVKFTTLQNESVKGFLGGKYMRGSKKQEGRDGDLPIAANEDSAKRYLRSLLLAEVTAELFHAREEAGLTQADLAQRLGTKQSAISRTENSLRGHISLRRFIDWAVACGRWPRSLELAAVDSFIELAQVAHTNRSSLRLFERQSSELVAPVGNWSGSPDVMPANAPQWYPDLSPQWFENALPPEMVLMSGQFIGGVVEAKAPPGIYWKGVSGVGHFRPSGQFYRRTRALEGPDILMTDESAFDRNQGKEFARAY
jgi:transcriptional regulator with XRE-family HTH domain